MIKKGEIEKTALSIFFFVCLIFASYIYVIYKYYIFIHISNTVCYFGLVVKADYHVWHVLMCACTSCVLIVLSWLWSLFLLSTSHSAAAAISYMHIIRSSLQYINRKSFAIAKLYVDLFDRSAASCCWLFDSIARRRALGLFACRLLFLLLTQKRQNTIRLSEITNDAKVSKIRRIIYL